jgi:hypothetical protein
MTEQPLRCLGQAAKPNAEWPVSILALLYCWLRHKVSKT